MIYIIVIAVISSIIYMLIKKYSPEYAVLAEICSVCLVLFSVYPYICDVIDFFATVDAENEYVSLLLKITGIAVLTQFSAGICSDSGETALSSKIEFAGKTMILALSLPLVERLLEFAIGMINEK